MKITVLEPLAVPENELRKMAKYITDQGHTLNIYEDISQNDDEAIDRIGDSDILVIANSPLNGNVIRSCNNLKMISVAFTGVDHVDLQTCKEKNILVSNAAGYSTNSVAELAFGMIISLYRNIVPLDKVTRLGKTKSGYRQRDISGKTLGIIGTGAIGSHMAKLGLAFGCNVIAYNRTEKQELIDLGVKYTDLNHLLKSSDIVSIHLPLNNETENLIGKNEFNIMKKDAILINTARGPIVNIEELSIALENNIIAGAGLDVFDVEPPLDTNYSILKSKNTVLNPHIGFATEEAMIRRAKITLDNIYSWLNNDPINIV